MALASFENAVAAQESRTHVFSNGLLACDRAQNLARHTDEIHLTVTSPPYLNAINYDVHIEVGEGDYRDRKKPQLDRWKMEQREIFSEVLENTVDGGYCAVVISYTKTEDLGYIPLPSHFTTLMEDIGWSFLDKIIWNKVTGGASRFGTTVQHPYPTYYYPNLMHEEILVFSKGERRKVKDEDSRVEINELMKKDVANNVWHIAPVPHNKSDDHPCPFPEEIPYRLVRLYSTKGDVVCDPMMGVGTTPKVAKHTDREAVGVEMREEYFESAREREWRTNRSTDETSCSPASRR